MKKLIHILLVISLAVSLVGCSLGDSDINSSEEIRGSNNSVVWTSLGGVEKESNVSEYIVNFDNGSRIILYGNMFDVEKLVDGRVIISYISRNNDPSLPINPNNITIIGMKKLETKLPYLMSAIKDTELFLELGDNDIEITDAWISLDRYVNIKYDYLYSNKDIKHKINIVIDNEKSTNGRLHLILKHSVNGDKELYVGKSIIAFDFKDYINEDIKEISIEYYNKEVKERFFDYNNYRKQI